MFNTYLGMPYSCILAAFGNRGSEVVILTGWVEDVTLYLSEPPKETAMVTWCSDGGLWGALTHPDRWETLWKVKRYNCCNLKNYGWPPGSTESVNYNRQTQLRSPPHVQGPHAVP